DGTLGAITIDGGTLGGKGTVATVSTTTNGKSISPGDIDAAAVTTIGTLHTGAVTFDSSDSFYVELNNKSIPGTTYDVLAVTGKATLNGAKLDGAVIGTVNVNDTFTILTATGGVSGTFAGYNGNPNVVFISGKKFTVVY